MTGNVSMDVTWSDGTHETLQPDHLFVACDPTGLPMTRTAEEDAVFTALKHFYFRTYVLKVKVPIKSGFPSAYGVILRPPGSLSDMDGRVYGFRNETAKQYTLAVANQMPENYVVVYRLWADTPTQTPPGDAHHEAQTLRDLLRKEPWWPYGTDFTLVDTLDTPYFQHFETQDVAAGIGMPWRYLDLQGENDTTYVHASTCFESVVTIWQYLQMLYSSEGRKLSLPADKAAKIVIMGAGVSGILTAAHLREHGYSDVTLIEKQNMTDADGCYGKTHSRTYGDLMPPKGSPYADQPTVCELGTCYLSPAYEDFVIYINEALKALDPQAPPLAAPRGFERAKGNVQNFRGIVLPGQIKPMPFDSYVLKAVDDWFQTHFGITPTEAEAEFCIIVAAYFYLRDQLEVMQTVLPMPPLPIDPAVRQQTFQDFVTQNDLGFLEDILKYSYSIQGYGPMADISAFYGLTWISATLTIGEAVDSFRGKPLVTFWPQGWGEVWRRLSTGMTIREGATVTRITRKSVADA